MRALVLEGKGEHLGLKEQVKAPRPDEHRRSEKRVFAAGRMRRGRARQGSESK